MKRIACVFLSFILALSLAACGGNETVSGDTQPPVSDADSTEENPNIESGEKTLVVYYSATGNTKEAAETIARILGADIFEIVPQDPYTSEDLNWTDGNSRVSMEHNDESRREVPLVKSAPDNWAQYDTVYIGYPIWWGIAAWPVNSFRKANDFTGKAVIPFCTSSSSGLGQSGKLLEQAAGAGEWLDGMRFSSHVSQGEIEEWLQK